MSEIKSGDFATLVKAAGVNTRISNQWKSELDPGFVKAWESLSGNAFNQMTLDVWEGLDFQLGPVERDFLRISAKIPDEMIDTYIAPRPYTQIPKPEKGGFFSWDNPILQSNLLPWNAGDDEVMLDDLEKFQNVFNTTMDKVKEVRDESFLVSGGIEMGKWLLFGEGDEEWGIGQLWDLVTEHPAQVVDIGGALIAASILGKAAGPTGAGLLTGAGIQLGKEGAAAVTNTFGDEGQEASSSINLKPLEETLLGLGNLVEVQSTELAALRGSNQALEEELNSMTSALVSYVDSFTSFKPSTQAGGVVGGVLMRTSRGKKKKKRSHK